ncbi:uncharacterized protein LOC110610133 isoform X3 [Manihot esculenta]|uniref:Uncharacterized protein n=1 Tax=Manihot esculenta TaxID=3983 RepID=A0ACB7I5K3_MANES|nr:uncharacterized protein LOC110610133 isoform X3 [Manihot esculenta]KAG8659616.1 hypothetical protein MANES_02G054400v8 [Manihot esculenta]
MPGNKLEEGICNVYELDNSSQWHLPQAVGGNWPVIDFNQWIGKPRPIGAQQNFNLKNYNLQQLDSEEGNNVEFLHVAFDKSYMQLNPTPEHSKSFIFNNQLNANELLHGCQNLQSNQNQPDSPTLTTNSERSEITEASSDFNYFRGQHQFVRDQQLSASQPQPMQQPGFNEIQLLQQHIMFKQLQEFQRQQQLQQLGDLRQHSSINQFSAISRQEAGGQFSPLISGTPVHDTSQMLRNWMHRGASPAAQGVSGKAVFSQEQDQALGSAGFAPHQLDVSLYGTPISNTRGNMSQYSHLQGPSRDSVNLLAKATGQVQKSVMQSAEFGNPLLGDQPAGPLDLVGLSQGALISKQELQMKNNFGQVPVQGSNSGVFPGNLLECDTPQGNTSVQEFNGRQEQADWPSVQQTKQPGSSQTLVPLDPIEAKILYNMDDNIWDAFGSQLKADAGGLGNRLEHPDSSYAFPSIQSGSWSALMQSAVAEASSNDTGVQEEWSSLSFQNTDPSTDNPISNFLDSEKQQTGWVDNNLQSSSSFSSKPFPIINDTGMNSSFPGFQQPGTQLLVEQKRDKDGSYESIENYSPQQKTSNDDSQKVQTFMHSNNARPGQMFENSQSVPQHQKVSSSDIAMDKGSESMVKSQPQISNGPHVALRSYEEANETQERLQTCHQRENSNDCSIGSSGHDQGNPEQLKFFGNISSSLMNVDKAFLPDFQRNSSVSEEVPSGVDRVSNASMAFHRSVLPDGSNVSAQTSEHMLELLHKVDQSKNDSSTKQFGSVDGSFSAEMPGAKSRDTSVSQLYTQSSASQGFGLRLAPPSQRMANSNSSLFPPGLPQTINNLNSRQVNPELEEKNQAWSSTASHEQAQRARWENKSGLGHKSFHPYVNMLGNSVASFSPSTPQARNQLQMRPLSDIPVSSQSLQTILPSLTGRFPPFNQVPSQDTLQQMQKNPVSQEFPVLEAAPVSQPSVMAQQGENLARPYNVWRNVPSQRQPFNMESLKFSNYPCSMDPTNNNTIITSLAPHGSNDQNPIEGGYTSLEIGASSNSQGFDQGEEHLRKEMLQQQISSKMHDSSQPGGISQGPEPVSDATVLSSGSLMSHAQQQDLDKVTHSNYIAQASSERNIESFSHSHNDLHNYSLLHQVQAMNSGAVKALDVQHAAALGGQHLNDIISRLRLPVDGKPNSTLQTSSFSSGDNQMLGFSAEARDCPTVKAPQQPALQSINSREMVTFGYNDSHTQSNHTDHNYVNLQMEPSCFKQYGALRNGQMVSMFDARLAKAVAAQFSLGKPSQNIQSSLEQLDAVVAGQGGRVWPSSQLLSSPYMLPPEVTNQVATMRPKKRKVSPSELLPWHKEVTHDSKRLQKIRIFCSMAEQDWAQATNRLTEKVEDEVEMIDDLQPMHRSKRRLILTTQLLQQLFHPAPSSILSLDSASSYDIISYFISRLSLGDVCSLAYCLRNEFLAPVKNSNVDSEKVENSERSGSQQFLAIVEKSIDRAKKLENDFQRLDKTASIVDIRAEFQELERFSVINRFAKFHVRGQIGVSCTGSLKPILQRHITAFPMPQNLPEGVQCLSL